MYAAVVWKRVEIDNYGGVFILLVLVFAKKKKNPPYYFIGKPKFTYR